MSVSTWVEAIPSGTSLVGNAPTDFPRVWKAVSSGMTVEHLWGASGGASEASTGELLPGASRVFIRDRGAGPGTDQVTGRMAFITTSSVNSYVPFRLLAYDSAATYLVGTAWLDEYASSAGSGYWLRQSGFTVVGAGANVLRIVFGTAYVGTPTIFYTTSNASWVFSTRDSDLTGFNSISSSRAGAAGTPTMYWESFGSAGDSNF